MKKERSLTLLLFALSAVASIIFLLLMKYIIFVTIVLIMIHMIYVLKSHSPVKESSTKLNACIVICAHSEEKIIKRSIESSINQDYLAMKVVIVDDASTDSTPEIALEYKKRFPDRVFYLRNERNLKKFLSVIRAFEKFDADVYVFVDADAEFSENFLSYYMPFMEKYHTLIVPVGSYNESKNIITIFHTIEWGLLSTIAILNFHPLFHGNGQFVKKEVLQFIKENNLSGTDDGAILKGAVKKGHFRFIHPFGIPSKEYATENFKDFVKQRERWYVFEILEALQNGDYTTPILYGFDVATLAFLLLSFILLFFLPMFTKYALSFTLAVTYATIVEKKLINSRLLYLKLLLGTFIYVGIHMILVTVSLFKVIFTKIPKGWYMVLKK